jgi:hypothetical protein
VIVKALAWYTVSSLVVVVERIEAQRVVDGGVAGERDAVHGGAAARDDRGAVLHVDRRTGIALGVAVVVAAEGAFGLEHLGAPGGVDEAEDLGVGAVGEPQGRRDVGRAGGLGAGGEEEGEGDEGEARHGPARHGAARHGAARHGAGRVQRPCRGPSARLTGADRPRP